ncbi:MAG: M28 family peptidase [Proteobacteria bacterium]|nr:M28 family peptidase [Pseudomonadota bacterium]
MKGRALATLLLGALVAGCATAPVSGRSAPEISAARIREHVRVLSSDDFLGRGPGGPGEAKALDYLAAQFAAAGLEPGGPNGSWFQEVELTRYDRIGEGSLSLRVGGAALPLPLGEDATASVRGAGRYTLDGAPLVFAGYGVHAPELGWSDYEGLDVRGKIVVVLANDPDFEAGSGPFGGRNLSYYGRVGTKGEEARKRGAAGLLSIHETAAASYPWLIVQTGADAPLVEVARPAQPTPDPAFLSGWLRLETAQDLVRRAGLDYAALKAQAQRPGFRGRALGDARLSARFETRASPLRSRNIIARLTGATRPEETVLYGAHWDAYGLGPRPDATGDSIHNGAVDNAVGTAELLEIARAFARGPRPARTLLFAGWTAEERGLLGAEYYATHPLRPLETTAAVINLDPHVALPRSRNIELIGGGRTTLEDDLLRAAAAQGLRVEPEPNPEAGWYYRSDHFAFSKRGVPALAFRIGRDLAAGGRPAGGALVDRYNRERYHQPSDEFDRSWTLEGAAQEARAAYAVGRSVANGAGWPGWRATAEFGAARTPSAASRR